MAIERTFSIIKPDAVAKNAIGAIVSRFEAAGLKVIASRMAHLSKAEAEGFYAVHKAAVLQRSGLVHDLRPGRAASARRRERDPENRDLMGATDPKKPRRAPSAPTSQTLDRRQRRARL